MKIKVIFILAVLAVSCGRSIESAIFIEPQPDSATQLNEIPKKLLGTYESFTDSVDSMHLTITDKEIIIRVIRNPNASSAELDSFKTRNLKDTVYQDGYDSMTLRVTADSVFQRIVHFDTLYYASDKYLMKKSKGYYFCNQKFRDKWLVRTLRVTDNGILISKLRSKEQIIELKDANDVEKLPTHITNERFEDELLFVRIESGLEKKR
jgi:hypothetical protein